MVLAPPCKYTKHWASCIKAQILCYLNFILNLKIRTIINATSTDFSKWNNWVGTGFYALQWASVGGTRASRSLVLRRLPVWATQCVHKGKNILLQRCQQSWQGTNPSPEVSPSLETVSAQKQGPQDTTGQPRHRHSGGLRKVPEEMALSRPRRNA
jgi:hypothetical protein